MRSRSRLAPAAAAEGLVRRPAPTVADRIGQGRVGGIAGLESRSRLGGQSSGHGMPMFPATLVTMADRRSAATERRASGAPIINGLRPSSTSPSSAGGLRSGKRMEKS